MNTKNLEETLEAIVNELGLYPTDPRYCDDLETYKRDAIQKISDLKEQASAYATVTMGSKIDAMVACLIRDMTGMELWRKVFNKMTKPAKRQLIGELLNSCLGNGYSTKPYIFEKENEEDL